MPDLITCPRCALSFEPTAARRERIERDLRRALAVDTQRQVARAADAARARAERKDSARSATHCLGGRRPGSRPREFPPPALVRADTPENPRELPDRTYSFFPSSRLTSRSKSERYSTSCLLRNTSYSPSAFSFASSALTLPLSCRIG